MPVWPEQLPGQSFHAPRPRLPRECVPLALLFWHGVSRLRSKQGLVRTLSADERTETQANLILLGYYEYLVDGQFGTGTYQALVAFQKSQGRAATGALIAKDRQKLLDLAAQVYNELGMDLVRDEEGQAALILPAAVLTVKTPGARGNTYATPDGDMVLETSRTLASERTFRTLYDTLKTPGEGRFILYSNYNDDHFRRHRQAGRTLLLLDVPERRGRKRGLHPDLE